jgi:hypothetical protein
MTVHALNGYRVTVPVIGNFSRTMEFRAMAFGAGHQFL